jgi:hypothetical protein
MAENKDRGVTYAGVMSTAAAITSLAALLKGSSVAASPGTGGGTLYIPPELVELLMAMAADVSDIDIVKLPEILDALQNLAVNVKGYPDNQPKRTSFRTQLLAANVGQQMASMEIPDGRALRIKAWPLNPVAPAYIRVAFSKADSENDNACWPLIANEAESFWVKNSDLVYVSATALPAWVICSVEEKA